MPGALAAAGVSAHGGTLGWTTVIHRGADRDRGRSAGPAPPGYGGPGAAITRAEPAKIKRSDYYWQSRNLAHLTPQERISRGLPSVHREEDWK